MNEGLACAEHRFAWLRLALAGALLLAEAAVGVASLFPRVSDDYRAYFIDHRSHVWPPCHPTSDYVEMKDPIEFGKLDLAAACVLLGDGWSSQEVWGVWNDGNLARLSLPYLPGQREATMALIAHARARKVQRIEVLVDGVEVGQFSIPRDGSSIVIPLPPTDRPKVAAVTLRVAGAYSPQDAGESPDPRKLGVGLVRIERR